MSPSKNTEGGRPSSAYKDYPEKQSNKLYGFDSGLQNRNLKQ